MSRIARFTSICSMLQVRVDGQMGGVVRRDSRVILDADVSKWDENVRQPALQLLQGKTLAIVYPGSSSIERWLRRLGHAYN